LIAIKQFHPMKNKNLLPNILSKQIISLLSDKSPKKKR
jgi:hypothetical protein